MMRILVKNFFLIRLLWSGENTPKSEIGKSSYQNWKSDPKNSSKAFVELKMEDCTMLLNFYRYGASFFSFFKLLTARD